MKNKILTGLLGFFIAILIITVSIGLPIYVRPFYYLQVDLLDIPTYSGADREDIIVAYNELLDYLTVPGCEFKTGIFKYSESGKSHFVDCKGLFDLNISALIISLFGVAVLLILTVHEYAHGYTAYKLGDPTARSLGRLSLNPIKHLDPLGALCMVLFHFGWAKPVPINPRNFKNPRRDFAITALAGPLINIFIGIAVLVNFSVFVWFRETGIYEYIPLFKSMTDQTYRMISTLAYGARYYNILLAVFNLLPIPPLDGSRILWSFLPSKAYFGVMKYEKIIMFIVFFLVWIGVFTTLFEVIVDFVITAVSEAVFAALEALFNLVV